MSNSLNDIHKQGHINGFGVAIVDENGILYNEGFGFSQMAEKKSYQRNTIQNIGSVSKTLIGVALLKAQELGKLSLDDPINKYLPFVVANPKFPEDTITIRHLATHSSSIVDNEFYNGKAYVLKENEKLPDDTGIDEVFNPSDSKLPMIDFLSKILTQDGEWYEMTTFTENRPGTIFEYSNIGASLAAAILEIAVESSYDRFTRLHILEPLGMDSSGWSFEDIDIEMHSGLYANPENELPLYSLITYPDGGLITSSQDLGKFLSELINGYSGKGKLLTRESYQELFTEQLPSESFLERDEEDDYDDEYNTGIFMGFTPRGHIGHTGGDPGIASHMFFNPKTQVGRLLIINTSVINSQGVDEFYSIWNTLGEYEARLKSQNQIDKAKQ